MEKKLTKAELVEKICKEQGLDPKKIGRLNMEELHKMDKVVPDEGADILGGEAPESPSEPVGNTEVQTTDAGAAGSDSEPSTVPENKPDVGQESEESEAPEANTTKVLLGYHPVTGKPVYK